MVLSAGIVVVRKQEEGWKYLFLRAYKNWDFPKGEVNPGEEPFETAQREVREETGITDLRFSWTRAYKETLPYRGGKKIARYYIAETSEEKITLPVSPELGRPEHNEYRWLSYDEEEVYYRKGSSGIRWSDQHSEIENPPAYTDDRGCRESVWMYSGDIET